MMNNISKEQGNDYLATAFRANFALSINAFLIHSSNRLALIGTGSGNYLARFWSNTDLNNDISLQSARWMAQAIAAKHISAVELLQAHFRQVDQYNPKINAVIWQDREAAMEQARQCDSELATGTLRGPLHGVPVTVKESFDLAGSPTTWGIPDWKDNIRQEHSDAVKRYNASGAIVYGKTNVPLKLVEWQSFNEIYGSTSNPWDTNRTPGGSSGGAAAALATGMSALEVGSDIGSSIRNPAHYCGVFGLKPTWNVLSMQGHLPDGWHIDIDIGAGGPLARSAEDLELAFTTLAGPSRFDSSCWQSALASDSRQGLNEFTVAVMAGDPASPVDTVYLDQLDKFAGKLEQCGATVVRNKLPAIDSEAHFTLYLKLLGAALSFGVSDEEVNTLLAAMRDKTADKQRVAGNRYKGMAMSHREWLSADNDRRKARLAFDRFFENVDVILAPVCASAAFPKDEAGARYERYIEVNGKPQLEAMQLFWSGYSGVTGLPSVVGPMAQVNNLPVGYQAITGHGKDYTALAFAKCVEREIVGFTAPPIIK